MGTSDAANPTEAAMNVITCGDCSAKYIYGGQHMCAANAIGIPLEKLRQSTGRPKGARNLNAKHPSSLAKRFKRAGLDWAETFALAIKAAGNYELAPAARRQAREDVRMWLRLLPYMVTTTNKVRVKRWKGKASKAAMIALETMEKI